MVPTDEDIALSLARVRSLYPGLGALKVLASIKSEHPEWSLSEKRLKKIINLNSPLQAQTGLDSSIDIKGIAPKVQVKLFPHGKGKGLVAREKILQGEVIWQEEPWIATADQ